jgi:hypothetical protein
LDNFQKDSAAEMERLLNEIYRLNIKGKRQISYGFEENK